ncbi:MAG: hypothetical protein ACYS7Y_04295 [Planctomycetota bacterium]|jgi:hypothetical protein
MNNTPRLDLVTAEVVRIVKDRGYRVCSPINVTFPGEVARIRVEAALGERFATVSRDENRTIQVSASYA